MSKTVPAQQELLVPSFDAPADAPFAWLRDEAATLREHLLVHGAVLLHGLPLAGPGDLADARAALGFAAHIPTEVFNNRSDFGAGILSPISWPDDRIICPFQESSFSRTFPSVVLTACIAPPHGDGRAHLSDARRIAEQLPAQLAERVRTGGWTLTRAFHEGFGISWREAFGVTDRAELDELLPAAGIEAEWLPAGTLSTTRRLPGVIDHPATGEECWFNQLAFLNAGSLDPTERAIMTRSFGRHLPMNTFLGDGSPLSEEELTAIQRAYEAVRVGVPWRRGDLLITDNISMAQGRSPYAGSPEFLIALGTYGEGETTSW